MPALNAPPVLTSLGALATKLTADGWPLGAIVAARAAEAAEREHTIGATLIVLRDLLTKNLGMLKSAKLDKLIALAEKPKWLEEVAKLRNLSTHPSKSDRDRMQRVLQAFFESKGAELVPVLDARDAVEKWKAT